MRERAMHYAQRNNERETGVRNLSLVIFQVLKIAILAEKYASDCKWYVDMMLHLISVAGDYVSEEVWNRVIQIIVNGNDVQTYAAKTVFEVRQCFYMWCCIIEMFRTE